MTCSTSLSGKNRIFLIAGILMIATTLRVTFTGAAPLLDTIRSAYSLTTAQTGLLTTLPLLAFALISPLAAPVARRFGMERSLFAALLLICAGIAIRSLPSPYLLFGGTAVIGGGIALGNVLLPGLIKRDFPHSVARLTGAYSLTMGAAAALGSAMVVPLALNGFGSGATMILGLTFIGLRASSAHQAAALSGMAQSVGYLLAACGPPLMGKIHDANGDWSVPLMGVAILSLLMAIFGLCAGRDKEIR
ncbi:TPA: CynX/NimT family MFS transporter [Escherichia coli]|nr:CynX/NimT family MFS transporter [Escherichia coli]